MNWIAAILFFLIPQQDEVPIRDRDAFIRNFDEVSESTTSISCDFVQSRYISISKEPLVSSGNLYFEDEKMRWEQKEPKDYLMVIKDEVLKIREDGKVKEHSLSDNKYMKGLREIMIGSMTGNLLKSDQFETELMENADHWIVNMVPRVRKVKKMFSHIKMEFNRETYRMERVILTEPGGDYTLMEFKNAQFNKDLKDTLFDI